MKGFMRVVLGVLACAMVAASAPAQDVTKERATIIGVDWNVMRVGLKDLQGRERAWAVAKDATVTFSDKGELFPNPKLADLVPPMYVFFTYKTETKEIVAFEVREVGFEPARGKDEGAAPTSQQQAIVTAVDANVGQVEVQGPAGRKTYEVDPKSQLLNLKAGDRVTLTISKRGDRDVVTGIRRR